MPEVASETMSKSEALRRVSAEGFPLLARGGQAEILDCGDGKVLRIARRPQDFNAIRYEYAVWNATVGPDKRAKVQTMVRVFREHDEIYSSTPVVETMEPESDPARHTRMGNLVLHAGARPGRYSLEIMVTDQLGESKRWASQTMDFEVR